MTTDSGMRWNAYVESATLVKEARELYWARMSPYLTFEGFLLAAFSLSRRIVSTGESVFVALSLGFFGLIVSYLWYNVNKRSVYMLITRLKWAKEIESQIEIEGFDEFRLGIADDKVDKDMTDDRWTFPGGLKHYPGNWVPVLATSFWYILVIYYMNIMLWHVIFQLTDLLHRYVSMAI